ncbi:aldo/keto reductase [Nitrosopumilus adriaticus]|uniref:Oxidoreductase, aldo/keto reductase family protein n=1 Tax=Nitrosopumilus adriaticus TaxID=1580092 RepID=A0A0D5C551_9ARCH|nr:aldo/keto reductase [Nitrosopumilus adriaticus]AJW71688.1 Oxidoreductase, aldo/keto reductase family protein [Nitrosopumilus adriaticus]
MSIEKTALAKDLEICRILNGMWQVAGGHGQIEKDLAITDMIEYHNSGFTTWDLADIYGPAESLVGEFREKIDSTQSQALTKFVPNPGPMSNSIVTHYIEQSLKKMNTDCIDLLQFHWWDYNDTSYLDALHHLSKLQSEQKIKHLGLTNFDTERVRIMIENGFHIVSNQVQFSILDQRPEKIMTPFFVKNGIKILAYGTLLGGFFSEKYLGLDEPHRGELTTASLQKYKNMIDVWGGWQLFQELLCTMDEIAKKHQCSIANVATRFVLDKSQVAGVIIGARLGITNHRNDNAKVFDVKLDNDDISLINSVTAKSNDLFEKIGDCGDEYR